MIKLKLRVTFNAKFFCSASGDLSVTGYNILLSINNRDAWIIAGYGNKYFALINNKNNKSVLARIEKKV